MNTGSMASDSNVICQERTNIAPSVTATVMRLPTTDENVSVKACCAPSTSLLSREMRAPVCVRVKKAMGIRPTWVKTFVRMS